MNFDTLWRHYQLLIQYHIVSYPGTLGWNFCHFGDPWAVYYALEKSFLHLHLRPKDIKAEIGLNYAPFHKSHQKKEHLLYIVYHYSLSLLEIREGANYSSEHLLFVRFEQKVHTIMVSNQYLLQLVVHILLWEFLWLELNEYKNDSIQSKTNPVLKLPRFFPCRIGDEKERQFQYWNSSLLNGVVLIVS